MFPLDMTIDAAVVEFVESVCKQFSALPLNA